MVASGVGFGFGLPLEINEIFSNTPIEANQLSGDALSGWIEFDAEGSSFKIGTVPQGGLPIQLVLSNATTSSMIIISEG